MLAYEEDVDHEFDTFKYAALEWPDRPEDAAIFEPGVLAAAKDLAEM